MERMFRRMAAVIALATALTTSAAFAQERPPPARPPAPGAPAAPREPVPDRVTIELMVVHATNGHDRVDARLRPIMQHLRFLDYKGFDLQQTHTQPLAVKQEASFEIVGDRTVKIELIERTAEAAKIRVRMLNRNGKLLDTTVSIHRNRSFMVAGPRHEDGVLILPITARY